MIDQSVFQSIFYGSSVGEYLLAPTHEATILAVNDAFLKTVARRRDELVGKGLFEAFPGNPEDPGDTGVNSLYQSLQRVIRTREPEELPVQRYPIVVKSPDGTERFEERFWNASNTPIFDDQGSLICISHRTVDITERHRAYEAAKEQAAKKTLQLEQSRLELETERKRLQAIVDTIPTGLIMVDEKGAMILENDEWRRTWAGNALLDSVVDYDNYKGYRPDTGERIANDEWPCAISLLQGVKTRDVILDIDRFNGTRGTIVVSSAPLYDDSGRVTGAVAANMDITELRSAQTQLMEADRRKDEFLAMLSHELRSPIAPIQNSLYILDRADPDSQQSRNARDIIGRQVTHLTHIVDDLLDVTRIANGKVELQREKLNLSELVKRTVEDYRDLTNRRHIDLNVVVADEPLIVEADGTRISQVIGNLLTNAAKFTQAEGHITITVRGNEKKVRVSVKDTGSGIAPELLPTIFKPFTQASQSLARTEGGLGLGLAVVKGIVELHGGSLSVESTLNVGTEFTIELPLTQTLSKSAQTFSSQSDAQKPRFYRVLVIDDNVDSADTLGELVAVFGHTVEVAYDGQSGVSLAEAHKHELVLCDIGLPDIDGYEVAKTLRKILPAETRLVAVSGYAQPEDKMKALESGFNAHCAKPIDIVSVKQILDGDDLFGRCSTG